MPKLTKGQAFVGTEEQLNNLIGYLSKATHAKRNIAIMMISYYCGLRAVEIAALDIHDVCRNGQIADVVQLRRTKGNKPRVMYLTNPKVKEALMVYLDEMGWPLSGALFISQHNKRFTNKTLQKHFEYLYKKYGYTGFSSHSGRRTLITNVYRLTKDPKLAQHIAGHLNIATTMPYIDSDPVLAREVLTNL